TELKFDDTFQTNFKADNFFDYLEADKDILGTFDLVIGNPPFKSLSLKDEGNGDYFGYYNEKNSAGIITRKSVRLSKEIFLNNKQKIYPDGQLALMFLDQLPLLLKRGGLLCLIMPSAPLLYNNSTELRRHFFPKYQVLQILDFTNLDAVLFEADVPTAAIFVRKQSHNKEKPITHITFRRTKCVEEKIFFEIDKYDFHYTSQQSALDDKHVWKCNLLGGGRLNGSIARLSHNRTVGDFIEEKKWRVGEGYISSSNRNFDEADYITGKPYLPAKAFAEDGFDKDQISIEHAKFFERPRVKELFSPPLMLIKENIGKNKREIPIGFSDEYLTFRSTIIGISASETQDKASLLSFYNNFKKYNDVLRFFISATSNQFLVTRGTLLYKQDLMNLPYPEDKVEMKLSFIEQILCDDILDYFIEIKSKSKNTKMSRDAKSAHLEGFGEVFAKMLNSIYGKSGKVFSLRRGFDWGNFFITEFSYGESPVPFEIEKIEEPVESLQSLIETNYGGSAYLTKVLKLYEPNKIYLVKPKTLRYWLRSIAIKDADEVFSDLIKAGY
ncbi:MAG TPA: hypothetical protein VK622_00400, partial [Puia sp.]|nr:hypothetical protein [Puia sp.]